jgi:hypothetical protein
LLTHCSRCTGSWEWGGASRPYKKHPRATDESAINTSDPAPRKPSSSDGAGNRHVARTAVPACVSPPSPTGHSPPSASWVCRVAPAKRGHQSFFKGAGPPIMRTSKQATEPAPDPLVIGMAARISAGSRSARCWFARGPANPVWRGSLLLPGRTGHASGRRICGRPLCQVGLPARTSTDATLDCFRT